MNKPDWKDAPEWANWWAEDSNGKSFWYEYEPVDEGDGSYGLSTIVGRVLLDSFRRVRPGHKVRRP